MHRRTRTLRDMRRLGGPSIRLVVAIVALGACCNLAASPRLDLTVGVRLFNNFGVAATALASALEDAHDIFLQADVAMTWRDCSWQQQPLPNACRDVPAANEVLLRLVASPAPPASIDRVSLGTSLVDLEGAHGMLATVFPDRVSLVARVAGVAEAPVLGRVIAHEIGHLLLGVGTHGERGLMRGFWSRRSLQYGAPADWRFSASESASMRSGLLARLLMQDSRQVAAVGTGCGATPELSSPACDGSFGGISTDSSGLR